MIITATQTRQTPENIFTIAVEYDYAANTLLKDFGNHRMQAMNPILFNQAFALELYLKCLIYITKGKKAPNTHELKTLYYTLETKDQSEIEILFNQIVFIKRVRRGGIKLRSRWKETKFKGKPSFNYTIEEILTFSNLSVVENRYPFDYESKRYYGIGYLSQAVLKYIVHIKPDWKSKLEPLNLIFLS